MSITRDGGDIVFHCEDCSEYFETETSDFRDAVDAVKGAGWLIIRTSEWEHRCPADAEAWKAKNKK